MLIVQMNCNCKISSKPLNQNLKRVWISNPKVLKHQGPIQATFTLSRNLAPLGFADIEKKQND
jgi:hypothetical protein